MPRDFLFDLQDEEFPKTVTDEYQVQCIHVLIAAELIEAEIKEGPPEHAVILRITPMGRAEIERIRRDRQ